MTHSPYISRVIFGQTIKQYRNRKGGMAVAEASRRTGMSEAKIRRLESGTNKAINLSDAYTFSFIYECSGEETKHLASLVEGADSPGWYHDYDVPLQFAHFIEQEAAASTIHIVDLQLVTGLFQTEGYLDGLRARRPGTKGGPDQGLRAERRNNVFKREEPPAITYIASEAALRCQVGGPEVIRAQVRHLAEMTERDNIEIYVIPLAAGTHPSIFGSYTVMYFDGSVFPTTVYIESLHGSHYEDADKIVSHHEEAFRQTIELAATPLKEFISEHDDLA